MAAKRFFIFNWHKNEKYRDPLERNTQIRADDPNSATTLFQKEFGNLKKNTINYIQEVNANGKNIGEKIIPEN